MAKKKKISSLLIGTPAILLTSYAITSCSSINVENSEKIKQDELLKSEKTKKFLETKFLESILTSKLFTAYTDLGKAFEDESGFYYKETKKAFDFYQKQELKKDKSFTVKMVNDLNSKNLLSSKELEELQKEIGPNKLFTDKGFKILFSLNYSEIKNDILKMILVKNFLLNSSEQDIINSEIYKNYSSEKNTNYAQRNAFQNTNPKTKDFFLKTLLLEKQVAQVWKFESSDANDINSYNLLELKDENSFNSLIDERFKNAKTTNKIESFELLNANDDINLENLLSYEGILYNQGSNAKGSFNYDIYQLKREYSIKSGFVDENTRIIYSKNDLKSADNWKGKKELSIKLKDSFDKNKNKFQLTADDLEFENQASHSEVTYSVASILPFESESLQKRAYVIAKMVLTSEKDSKSPSSRFYIVEINWDGNENTYSPKIASEGREIQNFPSFVKVINNDFTKISATYLTKIVPIYDEIVDTTKDNVVSYKRYFSLNNTPWNSDSQKEILAFSLYLADKKSLYNEVEKFYNQAGYKIEYKDDLLITEKK
ncbi:HinT-interacting membrane complex lipoprotein P60 [Mesomycoplasma molare]|uniref:P60-like lipoprotein n=1 Tax=Mesomycoplasma molare TaxID=171288 RepID=A0ABY5TUK3_9BACT|nr:hypothetical protein [Mesomycoplasma molare]UWD34325.1 hypothetical protein NX772_00645 [Mesomycoplasma molare]